MGSVGASDNRGVVLHLLLLLMLYPPGTRSDYAALIDKQDLAALHGNVRFWANSQP
jgi:hypothetical protein